MTPRQWSGRPGTAVRKPGVSWAEVALVAALCWLATGVGYVVFAALDEPGLSVAPLLGFGLAQWFWTRHHDCKAASAAAAAGVTLFGLVDVLRPDLGRFVGNALATGLGAMDALTVFAFVGRFRARTGH